MELFINALVITFGVLSAVVVMWLLFNAARTAFAVWTLNQEEKVMRERRDRIRENRARAKEHFHGLALEALQNSDVKDILEALKVVPYVDKATKDAKKQNYERQKLQACLRMYVPDANVRGAIYDIAA